MGVSIICSAGGQSVPNLGKTFWTGLLYNKTFTVDNQTRLAKWSSQPISLSGTRLLWNAWKHSRRFLFLKWKESPCCAVIQNKSMVRKFITYAFHVVHSYMLVSYMTHMGDQVTCLLQNWCEDEAKRSENLNFLAPRCMTSLCQSTTCIMKQVQISSTNIFWEFYNHIKNI